EIKRRTNQMAAIKVVTSMVGQSLDLEKTLATALEIAVEIVDAEASGISLIDHEAGELVLRAQRGWINDFVVTNPMRIPLGMGMSVKCLKKTMLSSITTSMAHKIMLSPDFAVNISAL
ncbi:MAG TPA: hypothetical protein PLZ51_09450, partial [Aggregatilineales bacterium]|nr:hypothetical protein [Aggregatilineales bacterium]